MLGSVLVKLRKQKRPLKSFWSKFLQSLLENLFNCRSKFFQLFFPEWERPNNHNKLREDTEVEWCFSQVTIRTAHHYYFSLLCLKYYIIGGDQRSLEILPTPDFLGTRYAGICKLFSTLMLKDLEPWHCAVQLCWHQQGQRAEHLHTGQRLRTTCLIILCSVATCLTICPVVPNMSDNISCSYHHVWQYVP